MYSASKGNYEITKYLIDNGGDVHAQDEEGNSVLSLSIESKNEKVINLIKENLVKVPNEDSVEELVNKGDLYCREKEDYENGIVYYTKALQITEDSEIYKKRGSAYFALKRFDSAITDFSSAINKNPDDIANMYFFRGLSKSLLAKEDKNGACEDFQKAKKLGYDLSGLNGLNEYCGVKNLE